jgi:hypothetical protein
MMIWLMNRIFTVLLIFNYFNIFILLICINFLYMNNFVFYLTKLNMKLTKNSKDQKN